jgi:hypothetical protein
MLITTPRWTLVKKQLKSHQSKEDVKLLPLGRYGKRAQVLNLGKNQRQWN